MKGFKFLDSGSVVAITPEVRPNEQRRFDERPQRKVRPLLRVSQRFPPGVSHL